MSICVTSNPCEANLITHTGTFHADEVLATVILSKKISGTTTVLRTFAVPEEEFEGTESIIYDIGGGKFDHHQKGGNGTRENGVPYASAGLVWKEFGLKILSSKFKDASDAEIKFIFDYIDKNLIQGVDAYDNGVLPKADYPAQSLNFSEIIRSFNPTWNSEEISDSAFIQSAIFAEVIFDKLIETAHAKAKAESIIEKAISDSERGIMTLPHEIDWQDAFFSSTNPKAKGINYVIFPSKRNDYKVRCVPDELNGFGQRMPLPVKWRGLKKEELQKCSGVSDAIFCHPNGFIAAADSFKGALQLAELASWENL